MERSAVARVLVGSAVLTALLYVLPGGRLVGRPLVLLATLVHELGHGAAAAAVGGDVDTVRVFADGSGVTTSLTPPGRLRRAAVAAGGLLGPALLAAAAFTALRRPGAARAAAAALGVALLVATLLVVRGWLGMLLAVALGGALVAAAAAGPSAAQGGLAFLGVQLALSAFSARDYLFTRTARTTAGAFPSDVEQIARALFLPWFVWGALVALLSLGILAGGLWLALRPHGRPASAGPATTGGEAAG